LNLLQLGSLTEVNTTSSVSCWLIQILNAGTSDANDERVVVNLRGAGSEIVVAVSVELQGREESVVVLLDDVVWSGNWGD